MLNNAYPAATLASSFSLDYQPTHSVSLSAAKVPVRSDYPVLLELWDNGSDPAFRSDRLRSIYAGLACIA
jgi:hypothetical protein